MRVPHSKLWLLLIATGLLVAQLLGDIRWRDGGGGPKTGVSGLVNLPSATHLNSLTRWRAEVNWDGWRNLDFSEQLVLQLPSNMTKAVVFISHQGVVGMPAVVEDKVTIQGQVLKNLLGLGFGQFDLTFMSTTHILRVRFELATGKSTYVVLAR